MKLNYTKKQAKDDKNSNFMKRLNTLKIFITPFAKVRIFLF